MRAISSTMPLYSFQSFRSLTPVTALMLPFSSSPRKFHSDQPRTGLVEAVVQRQSSAVAWAPLSVVHPHPYTGWPAGIALPASEDTSVDPNGSECMSIARIRYDTTATEPATDALNQIGGSVQRPVTSSQIVLSTSHSPMPASR